MLCNFISLQKNRIGVLIKMNDLILYTTMILFLIGLIFCIWSIFHIRKNTMMTILRGKDEVKKFYLSR